MLNNDLVILVNELDEEIGLMPKLEAHQTGALHRAFSIFIFNTKGELLLQQRAMNKYHSAGLWSNTCCSHPRKEELCLEAGKRRLFEEMGMQTELTFLYSFIYHETLENDLVEYELDHIFVGYSDDKPIINLDEVANYKYISLEGLQMDIEKQPANYSIWLKIILPQIASYLKR